ncbi:AHH domain-containing protein [Agarilytica rhodophyticola]|uniref:AHH domain-containing protein n=1 Tax=Agarilytica rhodophyticola TaxID=1737490 RepID=UPI000B346804|nr:AHH domain-containing protein [Agarilytica rhodophyticola]
MAYDDLYMDMDDDYLELQFSLRQIISDQKIIDEAIKYYMTGLEQDLVYAESVLAKGGAFSTVNKLIAQRIGIRADARPNFTAKLRKALIVAKRRPDASYAYDAHHIVAKNEARANRAAKILKALGIDIDDPDNGVFLPSNDISKKHGNLKSAYVHNTIHTNIYYSNVNFQIIQAYENNATKDDMKEILQEIAEDLQLGVYPIYSYIPGAEGM